MTTPLTRAALVCSAAAALVAGAGGTAHADDIGCDVPAVVAAPVPGAMFVVGETTAERVVAAHWSCHSTDTGAVFTLYGTLSEYVLSGGGWRLYDSDTKGASAVAGSASVDFVVVEPYAPSAVNAWHYVRFDGRTPDGRWVTYVGEQFYVARA